MKHSKIIAAALAATCVLPFALCACGSDEDPDVGDKVDVGEGMKEIVLEAEYTPVADKIGGAQSGSASGYDLIVETSAEGVSNGYFVSNMHMTGCKLEFTFNAERAGTTAIYISMFSQWGNTTFTPSNFGIVLNGTEITYNGLQVKAATDDKPVFTNKLVTSSAAVKAGENKLELIVRENTLNSYSGGTGAPAVDCVKLVSDTGITWTPLTENLDHVGKIEV